jgi:hypothetical protein
MSLAILAFAATDAFFLALPLFIVCASENPLHGSSANPHPPGDDV